MDKLKTRKRLWKEAGWNTKRIIKDVLLLNGPISYKQMENAIEGTSFVMRLDKKVKSPNKATIKVCFDKYLGIEWDYNADGLVIFLQ